VCFKFNILKILITLQFLCVYIYVCVCVCMCKAILLQAWTGPEVSKRLRLPDLKTFGI